MFMENSFDDVIMKPIDTVLLNAVLEKWIPKAKQIRFASKNTVKESAPVETATDIKIEGLDVRRGILRSGGTFDLYVETLFAFSQDGSDRLVKIKECLDEGNIAMYTTHVHGIKSAAAFAGADLLSESAAVLEDAGRKGDLDTISKETPDFLKNLEILLGRVGSWLEARNVETSQSYSPEAVQAGLRNLKTALETLDVRGIQENLDRLQDLTKGTTTLAVIRKISLDILNSEYEEATASIESLLDIS